MERDRQNRVNGMLLGAFLGDAIALGPHWIYDVERIQEEFGELKGITPPPLGSYHKGKGFGDWTHYGDQTFMLLDYLAQKQEFSHDDFLRYFSSFMSAYSGYKDHATRDTLAQVEKGVLSGSSSNELGGTARMAAPLYYFSSEESRAVEAAVEQCGATHRDEDLLAITRLLAQVVMKTSTGVNPLAALEELLPLQSKYIRERYDQARKVQGLEAEEALPILGQMCSSQNAFPAVIYLLYAYELDPVKTLLKNAAGGGDSAARGMVLGAILGAWVGQTGLPEHLLQDMKGYSALLKRIEDFNGQA